MKLRISPDLALPLDAVTEALGILAVRRAGKSNAAVVLAEEMFDAKLHWVAIDPKGDWYGIRADGPTRKGIPIPILGGEHGDVPLDPNGGAAVADLIVDEGLTCVVDVSTFDSEREKIRFLLAFGDRLFRRKRQDQPPTHVFFEEADDYVPQKPFAEQARLVHVMARILKQGGHRGLGGTIISQRSAVVNKDVLTQVQTMFALRTTSPQDRKAIEGWVSYSGENPQIVQELPSLADGEAWVWSPNWLRLTKKIRFRRRGTFDSASTPSVKRSERAPATLADVDLSVLQKRMATSIEKAKADDPRELRKKVSELERALVASSRTGLMVKEVKVPVLEKRDVDRLSAAVDAFYDGWTRMWDALLKKHEAALDAVDKTRRALSEAVVMGLAKDFGVPVPRSIATRSEADKIAEIIAKGGPRFDAAESKETGQRRVLQAVVQGGAAGQERRAIQILTGLKRSSVNTYLQKLKAAGLISGDGSAGVSKATDAGRAACPAVELPTGEALTRYWLNKLPQGEAKLLTAALKARTGAEREWLETETGLKRSSVNTYLQKLAARRLIEKRAGRVWPAAELL